VEAMTNQRAIANALLRSLIVLVARSCSHIGSNPIACNAATTGHGFDS
jgi:hypothetical protein